MDLTKLLVILLLCGGGFYMWKQNEEKKQLLAKLAEITEPAEEGAAVKPESYLAKPSIETKVRILQPVSRPASDAMKRIICPHCKGEGGVMVRRPVNGTITDVKFMCSLCMGKGKRELMVVAPGVLCPDCGGMGKRIVSSSAPSGGRNSGLGLSGRLNESDGRAIATSCSRCLGAGYVGMPGLN